MTNANRCRRDRLSIHRNSRRLRQFHQEVAFGSLTNFSRAVLMCVIHMILMMWLISTTWIPRDFTSSISQATDWAGSFDGEPVHHRPVAFGLTSGKLPLVLVWLVLVWLVLVHAGYYSVEQLKSYFLERKIQSSLRRNLASERIGKHKRKMTIAASKAFSKMDCFWKEKSVKNKLLIWF